jgi:hypothetical protein
LPWSDPDQSKIDDERVRDELKALAHRHQRELVTERGMTTEAQVLDVINELLLLSDEPRLSIKAITAQFIERYGEEYERKVSNKWIGGILRKRLGLKPQRVHGTFVIPLEDMPQLNRLREKFGLTSPEPAADTTPPSQAGTWGDIG